MKIVVGLGNPGVEYAGSRHNAGMMLVDKIYEKRFAEGDYGWRREKEIMVAKWQDLVLVKTAGWFMNESGRIIQELKYKGLDLADLYLAHDDLDIRLGEYKVQKGVGPKVHNGVNAVEQAIGGKEFWRIRIGIENRDERVRASVSGEEYVLQRFTAEEKEEIDKVVEEMVRLLVG